MDLNRTTIGIVTIDRKVLQISLQVANAQVMLSDDDARQVIAALQGLLTEAVDEPVRRGRSRKAA